MQASCICPLPSAANPEIVSERDGHGERGENTCRAGSPSIVAFMQG
jgi:hypothetical protein